MKIDARTVTISAMVLFMAMVSAHATIVTSMSDPSLDEAYLENFSSARHGTDSFLRFNDLTITAPGSVFQISNEYSGLYNTQGNSLNNDEGFSRELLFTFSTPQAVFGFNYGALDQSWTFSVYDSSHHLIESTLVAPDFASNAGDFVALTSKSPDIAYATFTEATGRHDYILLDNLMYSVEVPEPSDYAVFVFGAAVAFVAYRRSRSWKVQSAL